jgi:hypothetical protein
MDPRLGKWLRWLDVIETEIQELVIAKYTFHEVQRMIAENAKLQVSNSFYRYFTSSYVSHVVMGLRRQIKTDAQSISLALLLRELTETPHLLTRAYYVSLYEGSTVEHFADRHFNQFAASGDVHVDPSRIAADLQKLRDASARCEEFADKRLAHRDKCDPKALPTYNEVDACIDLLDELYVKYHLLFHAKSMVTLLPTAQCNWTEIFRIPWIEKTT